MLIIPGLIRGLIIHLQHIGQQDRHTVERILLAIPRPGLVCGKRRGQRAVLDEIGTLGRVLVGEHVAVQTDRLPRTKLSVPAGIAVEEQQRIGVLGRVRNGKYRVGVDRFANLVQQRHIGAGRRDGIGIVFLLNGGGVELLAVIDRILLRRLGRDGSVALAVVGVYILHGHGMPRAQIDRDGAPVGVAGKPPR